MEVINPGTQAARNTVTQEDAEEAVRVLLLWLGDDPSREGLLDTPARVARSLRELAGGLLLPDPAEVLARTFSAEECDTMIWVRGMRFTSMCEHHLLPFTGEATLAYIPHKQIIGLSKVPRLITALAARPQLQERLTGQIAQTFQDAVQPLGVGVILKAHHHCMGCRGAKQPNAEMITSCLRGVFREATVRAEFLGVLK